LTTPGRGGGRAFDSVRREIARRSLERLISDGRIHPGRIEELVEQVKKELEEELFEAGKKAALDASISGLHRKQLDLLGRLKYRTSYGQNVLRHSLEVAFLCQAIADEYGNRAETVWTEAATGKDLEARLLGLPGIGAMKARALIVIVGKRFGIKPPGWDEVAPTTPTLGDVDSPEALAAYQANKREQKAAARAAKA
jgi:hypothetical protein